MFNRFKGGFLAAAVATFGLSDAADAAVVGGASLDITGVITSTPVTGAAPGVDLGVDGGFAAESQIADFDEVLPYEASALLSVGAPGGPLAPVFGDVPPLGPVSINSLIGDLGAVFFDAPGVDVDDLLAVTAPVLFGPDDMGSFIIGSTAIFYDIDTIVTSPGAIEGDFTLDALLTGEDLMDLTDALMAVFGVAGLPPSLEFELNLAIAPAAVPAPAALSLVLTGLAAFGAVGWRRRKRA